MREQYPYDDQELKLNMIVYLSFCVTRAQHSGKGLASRLATVVCEHGRDTKRISICISTRVESSNAPYLLEQASWKYCNRNRFDNVATEK